MLVGLLVSGGVVCAINTVLALLMVVADATIANYGECTLTINDERTLSVRGGKSLLSTLKDEAIFIPSACGGRGSCGLCKLRILEGAGDLLPTELPWLTGKEREEQTRLSCQIKVKGDLRLVIPEELFSVKQYTTRVLAIDDLTHDIKRVRLEIADPPEIEFTAGQFVQFEVPEYELTDEPVYRAYSIASSSLNKKEVELEIRLVPSGICTTYVFKYLQVGEQITINGPYGDFSVRDTDADIIFIEGGSGMAPVKSILCDMESNGSPRKATYFFGARARRDLFLVDEMRRLEQVLPDFTFIPALSEPDPGDDWSGETGLITDVVDRTITTTDDTEAYLCGSPLMIDACVKVLKRKGLTEDRIFYDKFA